MSILVKGVEMPKNCEEYFARKAELSQEKKVIYVCCFARTDYPLVPVPPHGDLIDRDAARGSIKPGSPEDERNGCTFDTVKKLMYTMLDRAPTIIPAESITTEEEKNDK